MNLSIETLHTPLSSPPFWAPRLPVLPLGLPSQPALRQEAIPKGWMKPHPHIIADDTSSLMESILSADKSGAGHIVLPSGCRVNIHPGLVAVAAGMATCKSCGVCATTAVEFMAGGKIGISALWFVIISEGGSWLPMTADHVVPESRGGATHGDNLACLCRKCNMLKADCMEAGLNPERRYHSSSVLLSIVRDNHPSSAQYASYRRMLKDRASQSGVERWLPHNKWLKHSDMEVVRKMLLLIYGLRLKMFKNQGKLFPSLPSKKIGNPIAPLAMA